MSTAEPKSTSKLSVPHERFFQLHQLAADLGGATMSETLKTLFAAARAQGLMVGHEIPGVTVNSFKDGIVVQFDDNLRATFTLEGASDFVATIRQFVSGSSDVSTFLNLDHDYCVRRKGRGLIITINAATENESVKSWNLDLADEFADLIEVAIKRHTAE